MKVVRVGARGQCKNGELVRRVSKMGRWEIATRFSLKDSYPLNVQSN